MASAAISNAPVVRPHSRASSNGSHDNDSDYSLNLDALPQSNHNDSTFDLSQIQRDLIDVVRTDDIDGPTDFTQNLEYWMRLKLPNVVEPTTLQGQGKMDLEQYISSDEALSSTVDDPQTPKVADFDIEDLARDTDIRGTIERQSTGAPFEEHDERDVEPHQHSPQISNLDGPNDALDDARSEPSPSNRPRSRLQPSVEDYEESPSQMRAKRSASSSAVGGSLRRNKPGIRANSIPQQRKDEEGHELTLTPTSGKSMVVRRLREEMEDLKHKSQQDIQQLTQEHEEELEHERSAHEHQHLLNAEKLKTLEDQLAKEKEATRNHLKNKEDILSRTLKLEKELTESNKAAKELREQMETVQRRSQEQLAANHETSKRSLEAKDAEHQKYMSHLQERLASNSPPESKTRISDLESELSQIKQQLSARDSKLNDLQQKLADRENSLHLAQQRAEEAETILEETGQVHREEMANEQEIHDMQVSALEGQAASLKQEFSKARQELADTKHDLHDTQVALKHASQELTDRQLQTRDLQEENEALQNQALAAVERRQITNSRMVATKEQHSRDLDRIKATHTQEKLNLQKQAENAVLKMRGLLEKERKESKRLRKEIENSKSSGNDEYEELEDLRNEIRIANDHAEDVERERDQLKIEIEKMGRALEPILEESRHTKAELKNVKQDMETMLEEHEAINDIVAKKVHEAVQTKEKEWKRKVHELEKEMEIRSKLLMIEWGRAEVGASNPQPYKYKYLSDGTKIT